VSVRVRPAWQRRAELSQHFLRGDSATRLVRIASIPDSDLVIEIGPGRGALTKVLAGRSGPVIAVELDAHLADALRARCPGRVDVVAADFLDFELPRGRYTVIGNIRLAKAEFVPPPSVESVFLRLSRRSRPLVDRDDAARYSSIDCTGILRQADAAPGPQGTADQD
jgi:16S rRNA A1518/A1519 N6-dimethyltransferase RsmA/KsgA/DIM1 with predicted DNA glycosylase/AP lyase activity